MGSPSIWATGTRYGWYSKHRIFSRVIYKKGYLFKKLPVYTELHSFASGGLEIGIMDPYKKGLVS